MNILLLGTDNFTAMSLNFMVESGYNVVAVITHSKNRNGKKLQDLAHYYNIPYHIVDNINSITSFNLISDISPDIIFSIHFDKIIQQHIYKLAKICAINLHPSLLPKYKGLSSFQRVLLNNEKETGITIHHIVEEVSAGNIIAQKVIKLNENIYLPELYLLMMKSYPEVIQEALKSIEKNDFIGKIQDSSNSSFYGRVQDDEYIINKNGSVVEAYNKIRAFSMLDEGARLDDYIINRCNLLDMNKNGTFSVTYSNDDIIIKFIDGTLFINQASYYVNKESKQNLVGEESIFIIKINDILSTKKLFMENRKKYTNLFTMDISNDIKSAYYVEFLDSSFFILENLEFYKTYFLVNNISILSFYLKNINFLYNKPNILEIVYKDNINIYENILKTAGYYVYGGLIRLIKQISNKDIKKIDEHIIYAQEKHGKEILESYNSVFDKYVDGLMVTEKLLNYIRNNQVLVYVKDNKVLGCVIYTPKQKVYHLNYWFLTIEAKNYQGIGGALLHKLYYIAGVDNYIEAWCKKDNQNALSKYYHYGFTYDNISTDLFINI